MEKKTYTESRGKDYIDWNYELNKPDYVINWYSLWNLSKSWITCACGNQCNIIPRGMSGRPIDNLLQILGMAFTDYVFNEDRVGALKTLEQIENRSIELIKEIKNK